MRKTKLLFIFFVSACIFNQAQAQKKIVVLGSSTAAGGGATSNDSSWVGRLQAAFRKNTSISDPDTNIINLAVGGYVTYKIMPDNFITPPNRPLPDINANVTRALSYNPDIIIINMPSNDVASGYTEVEIMNNFRYLNQLITSQGIRAFITTTQPRNDIDLLHRTQARELVDSIYNNFGNNAINFWDDLVSLDGQFFLRDDRRSDYVHPNNTGHRLLFERVMARQIFGINAASLPIPGRIEAENFAAMSGIQTENTSDVSGGLNIGWQDNNDWMDYSVNVAAPGVFTARFRVASQFNGAQFQLRKQDGTILATLTVPNTGNFQVWQTIVANINLSAGQQMLRIITSQANGGWNFNWMEFVQNAPNLLPVVSAGPAQTVTLPNNTVTFSGSASDPDGFIQSYTWSQLSGPSSSTISNGTTANASAGSLVQGIYTFRLLVTDNAGASASSDVVVTVNAAVPPVSTIRIQAENYSAMNGIQTENTSDAGGGQNVAWQDNNDWMDYSVNLASAGTFTVNFRVASMFTGAQFQLRKSDGTVLAIITVPNTGNFQVWQTISTSVTLPAGQQTLRIVTTQANGGWNINWWEIIPPANIPLPTANLKIEAENYSAMSGIQTENTSDAGGGQNVAWQDNNDWMDYSVNVASAGTFTVNFRVASMFTGAQFQLRKSDGTLLATLTVPNTGNFQSWQTISTSVTFPAGQQTLRILTTQANGGWNINWWEISGTQAPPPPVNIKIEAENYSAMSGIQTENTSDAGGGQNVAWQDNNDWMDYNLNLTSAGTFTVNFRVASMFTGAQFQLRKSNGTVLSTLTVPNTGNFQAWQTISTSVTLPAGQQTLRIVTTQANGGWNINWWEIIGGGTTASMVRTGIIEKTSDLSLAPQPEIYPNPVHDWFTLKLEHPGTGTMLMEVLDMGGRTIKRFALKNESGILVYHIFIGDLQKGVYFLRVSKGSWSTTKKINKR